MLKKWTIKDSRPAFVNPWWRIMEEDVVLPDGSETKFYVQHNLGAVMIFALTDAGEVVLVRQYKHGVREIVTELPVGRIEEEDMSPEVAARRELEEETGYVADAFEEIGAWHIFSTSSTGKFHLFLARDARATGKRVTDNPREIIEVQTVSLPAVRRMLQDGGIAAISQLGGIYAALDHLKKL